MRTTLLVVALPLLASLAGGCAPPEDDEWTLGAAGDGKDDGPLELPKLASRYALRLEIKVHTRNKQNQAKCTSNPGDDACKEIYSDQGVVLTGLVSVDQKDGGEVALSEHLCDFRLPQHDTVSLDDKVWDHLLPIDYSAAINAVDGKFTLTTDPGVYEIGVRLAHPATDPFPTAKNDPRLSNDDQDDRVAVSVHLPLGRRIDFGARFIVSLAGTLGANGEWTSTTSMKSVAYDFMVYDDNIPFVDAHKSALEALANNELLEETTLVRMVPLRDNPGCFQAKAALK